MMGKEFTVNLIYISRICLLACLFLLSSCRQETSLDVLQCEVLSSIEQYPDSSYFKEISCIISVPLKWDELNN